MIPFEEVICQLILRHNCVVLPNFGGFVSKTISAQIDFEKGILQAPYKQLLFNRNLINDDGLVLAEYARLNGLYYQEGQIQLNEFTTQLNTDLALGKQVSIPKLGVFSKDLDGVVRFEQDRHFNFLLSSYGLTQVTFVPNPVQEELYLKWDLTNEKKVSSIEVYSINGQRVNEYHNLDKENTKNIPFQEYPQGTYLVLLNYTNGEQKSITILKQ